MKKDEKFEGVLMEVSWCFWVKMVEGEGGSISTTYREFWLKNKVWNCVMVSYFYRQKG